MDTDAYSGFVSVDVDQISCQFKIGILGGTHYYDASDDVLSIPPRFFRAALESTKRAVEFFRSRETTVIAHLGDVLAAENGDGGSQWTALQSFNNVRSKLPGVSWHIAPGASDARCFGPDGIGPALSSPGRAPSDRSYYSFFPAARWRVLVLDCCDTTSGFSSASSSSGLPDGVLVGASGGLGPAQLTWLSAQLSVASAEGERVIVLSNRGVRGGDLLTNASEVQQKLSAHPGVVAAFVSLGDGSGHYEKDSQGVHHISPLAIINRDINEDAHGCLEVYDDKLKLEMVGSRPDPSRLPNGWPTELELPRGGALVTSDGTAAIGFFLQFLFYMLTVIATPLAPVMRMLTSNEGVEDGEIGDDAAPAPPPPPPQPASKPPESGAPAADEAGTVV